MESRRLGMSQDSLYYFLAETALSKYTYDTAMAFNFSMRPKPKGPFREMMLKQRYRLYVLAGLKEDAARLRDSLAEVLVAAKPNRNPALDFKLSSGYGRENNVAAHSYPFDQDLGRFQSEGWVLRNQAGLLWPLPLPGRIPWSAGLGYDVGKSYFKDSLDYRTSVTLKADELWKNVSLAMSGQVGRIAGAGTVFSYKVESSFLSLSTSGLTYANGGYETEWVPDGRRRFDAFWASLYHDRSLRKGRGFSYTLSATGIRMDPVLQEEQVKVIYVGDVTQAKPTHYRDSSFQDTLPKNSIATNAQYFAATGTRAETTRSPQGLLALLPSLAYNFPLFWGFVGEAGGGYVLTIYPEAYSWEEASLPEALRNAPADLRALAMNKADGRLYGAALVAENGGLREYYGTQPLARREEQRIDQQAQASVTLRRPLRGWGSISLEGGVKRTWSTLSGMAPIWIPAWESGLSLKWSRNWDWIR